MKITVELEKEDFNAMHDVIMGALDTDKEITNEIIQKYWDKLPESIKGTAIQWGCGDTVFRDNMFEWIQKQENGK